MDITDNDIEQGALNSEIPILLEFWASWCPPCQQGTHTILENLSKEYEGKIKVLKINSDRNQKTANHYNVNGLPTFILIKNKKEVGREVGARSLEQLKEFINKNTGEEKVLVTGGCGFIGANLVEFLLEKTNWKINVLDNLSIGKIKNLETLPGFEERVTIFNGDIRNKENVLAAMEGCDYVVNLAAQAGVLTSIEDPSYDADVNVMGAINVLRACVSNRIKKFVQASSAAPLGDQEMPLDETKLPRPLSPYGASKMSVEGYCSAFSGSYGLNTMVLRFSNVYGPKSVDKDSLISLFIKKMLKKEDVFIYGDGTQTRDFVYVKDVCNAIYLSLISKTNNFELIHVASGKETLINDLVRMIKDELTNNQISVNEPIYKDKREGEIFRNYSDISKAKQLLNYEPQTDLEKGLKETVGYFLQLRKPVSLSLS